MYSIIKRFIGELPEIQRDILLLRDIDGMEFTEISDITGQKIENIRVILSRARRKIGVRLNIVYSYEQGR